MDGLGLGLGGGAEARTAVEIGLDVDVDVGVDCDLKRSGLDRIGSDLGESLEGMSLGVLLTKMCVCECIIHLNKSTTRQAGQRWWWWGCNSTFGDTLSRRSMILVMVVVVVVVVVGGRSCLQRRASDGWCPVRVGYADPGKYGYTAPPLVWVFVLSTIGCRESRASIACLGCLACGG